MSTANQKSMNSVSRCASPLTFNHSDTSTNKTANIEKKGNDNSPKVLLRHKSSLRVATPPEDIFSSDTSAFKIDLQEKDLNLETNFDFVNSLLDDASLPLLDYTEYLVSGTKYLLTYIKDICTNYKEREHIIKNLIIYKEYSQDIPLYINMKKQEYKEKTGIEMSSTLIGQYTSYNIYKEAMDNVYTPKNTINSVQKPSNSFQPQSTETPQIIEKYQTQLQELETQIITVKQDFDQQNEMITNMRKTLKSYNGEDIVQCVNQLLQDCEIHKQQCALQQKLLNILDLDSINMSTIQKCQEMSILLKEQTSYKQKYNSLINNLSFQLNQRLDKYPKNILKEDEILQDIYNLIDMERLITNKKQNYNNINIDIALSNSKDIYHKYELNNRGDLLFSSQSNTTSPTSTSSQNMDNNRGDSIQNQMISYTSNMSPKYIEEYILCLRILSFIQKCFNIDTIQDIVPTISYLSNQLSQNDLILKQIKNYFNINVLSPNKEILKKLPLYISKQ
ncbi:hypothetical protein WA158_006760 [Blastocystis sp. Blastoise]